MECIMGLGIAVLTNLLFNGIFPTRVLYFSTFIIKAIAFCLAYLLFLNYYANFYIEDTDEKSLFLVDSFKLLFISNYHLLITTLVCLYKTFSVYHIHNHSEITFDLWVYVQFSYFLLHLSKLPENYIMLYVLGELSLVFLQLLFSKLKIIGFLHMFLIFIAKTIISDCSPALEFHNVFYSFIGPFARVILKSVVTLYFLALYLLFAYKANYHINGMHNNNWILYCFNRNVLIKDFKKLDNRCSIFIIGLYICSFVYWTLFDYAYEDDGTGIWEIVILAGFSIPNSLIMRLTLKFDVGLSFKNNIPAGMIGLWCLRHALV